MCQIQGCNKSFKLQKKPLMKVCVWVSSWWLTVVLLIPSCPCKSEFFFIGLFVFSKPKWIKEEANVNGLINKEDTSTSMGSGATKCVTLSRKEQPKWPNNNKNNSLPSHEYETSWSSPPITPRQLSKITPKSPDLGSQGIYNLVSLKLLDPLDHPIVMD